MARETLIYGGLENQIIIVKLDADCSQDIFGIYVCIN